VAGIGRSRSAAGDDAHGTVGSESTCSYLSSCRGSSTISMTGGNMSDSQQYPNLPNSTWTCWQTNMVPYLTSQGCDNITFSGGDSGTLSFHHKVPLSNGDFAFDYSYDTTSLVLTLTITDSPDDVPNSAIFDAVQNQIYTCPPSQ